MTINIGILGCGLSGMLMALSLAKIGISSTIFENKSVKNKFFFTDVRTTALTPYSVNFLSDISVWQELKEFIAPMTDVYVVDNKSPTMLHLHNKQNTPLGYIVENSHFKKILFAKLQQHPLITLIDECEYRRIESYLDYTTILLEDDTLITCNLVIVCDGLHSKVRSYFFVNEIEKSYQAALTFNIKHEKSHENCAMEHFLPLGPFALLPLQDKYCSSVIWSTSLEQSSLLLKIPAEELSYLVQRNCGESLGSISISSNISVFPLRARLANRYYHNHLALIADSAHIIHPLAGQGLNQGIKDIESLTNLINTNGINLITLQKYQMSRQEDNFIMYKITDELNNIFSSYSKPLYLLRQTGFLIIKKLPFLKDFIINYAQGLRD